MGVSGHGRVEERVSPRLLGAVAAFVLACDLIALATVGATGGQAADTDPTDAAQAPTGGVPGGQGPGRSTPTAPSADGSAPQAQQGGPTTTVPLAEVTGKDWDFPATLTPRCGPVGQRFTLTLGLGVKGTGVFSVVYGDGKTPGPREFPEGGPDGFYSYSWTAAAAPGDGVVIIAASDAKRENSGTKSVPFRIVGVGERC